MKSIDCLNYRDCFHWRKQQKTSLSKKAYQNFMTLLSRILEMMDSNGIKLGVTDLIDNVKMHNMLGKGESVWYALQTRFLIFAY